MTKSRTNATDEVDTTGDGDTVESHDTASREMRPEDQAAFDLHFEAACEYAGTRDWEAAAREYRHAIRYDGRHYESFLGLGDALWKLRDRSAAAVAFLGAVHTDPERIDAHRGIKRCLVRGQVSNECLLEVRAVYEKLLEDEVRVRLMPKILSAVRRQVGCGDEAIRALDERVGVKNSRATSDTTAGGATEADSETTRRRPDFIILGAMKCGTTSLHNYLLEHPQVLPSAYKEIKFFNLDANFQAGTEWYGAHFPPIEEGSGFITGEASPAYIRNRLAASRMRRTYEDLKLIVILRDPVRRAISHYFHRSRNKTAKTLETEMRREFRRAPEYLADPEAHRKWRSGFVMAGLYAQQLRTWLEYFPPEQFLILRLEDMKAGIDGFMGGVYDFLGLPPHEQQHTEKRHNKGSYPEIDPDVIRKLEEFFVPHNDDLSALMRAEFGWTNGDFADVWSRPKGG